MVDYSQTTIPVNQINIFFNLMVVRGIPPVNIGARVDANRIPMSIRCGCNFFSVDDQELVIVVFSPALVSTIGIMFGRNYII